MQFEFRLTRKVTGQDDIHFMNRDLVFVFFLRYQAVENHVFSFVKRIQWGFKPSEGRQNVKIENYLDQT